MGGASFVLQTACDSIAVRKTRSLKVCSMRVIDRHSGPVFKGKLYENNILFLSTSTRAAGTVKYDSKWVDMNNK